MGCSPSSTWRSSNNVVRPMKPDECKSVNDCEPQLEPLRRRLTVGEVQKQEELVQNDEVTVVAECDDDRGLIANLDQQNLMELLKAAAGEDVIRKRWSLGSRTDEDLNHRESFANKTLQHKGDRVNCKQQGIGFTCRKGLKPESPNQDSWFILNVEDAFSIYAVMDGHGKRGHDVSEFIKENMPKVLVGDDRLKTDPAAALTDAFRKVQNMLDIGTRVQTIDASLSGSTVSVVVHSHAENKLWVAHCGDSRCCLGKRSKKGYQLLSAVELTQDHKPELNEEKLRIESLGGEVVFDGYANHRVFAAGKRYPGLNMSRSLGDLMGFYDAGISAEPEVREVQLDGEDELIILASDGVWEFITNQQACDMIGQFTSDEAMDAAETLAREAWDLWMDYECNMVVDDITALVIYFNKVHPPKSPKGPGPPPLNSRTNSRTSFKDEEFAGIMPGVVPEGFLSHAAATTA